jgi:hypothetical protein
MGFFDGGSSESKSYSGLRNDYNNSAFLNVLDRTPNDLNFLVNRLQKDVSSPLPSFNLNPQGFLPQQMEGVNTLGANLFGNVSSNYASRGLSSPANVSGVVGSALKQAAPQLMPIIGQNVRDSILIPETVKQQRFASLQNAMNLYPSLLGSSSSSSMQGPNILAQNLAQWTNPNAYANLISSLGSLGGGGAPKAQMY